MVQLALSNRASGKLVEEQWAELKDTEDVDDRLFPVAITWLRRLYGRPRAACAGPAEYILQPGPLLAVRGQRRFRR